MVVFPGGILKNDAQAGQIIHHFALGLLGQRDRDAQIAGLAGQFVIQGIQIGTIVEGAISRVPVP